MAWVLDDILLGLVDCLGTICGHLYSQDIKRQDHSGVCNRSNICSIHRILFVVLHLWQSWFEPGQTNDSKGSGINRNRVICSFAGISTWNGIFFHCYLPVNSMATERKPDITKAFLFTKNTSLFVHFPPF